jgi:hypothetical protein
MLTVQLCVPAIYVFLFISMLRIVLAKARQNFVLLFASLMVLLRNILPAAGPAKAGYSLRSWCV